MGKKEIERIIEKVRKFKKGIKKKFSVLKVIIFGSAARGKMGEHSDVDIIVISKKFGRKDTYRITPELYGEWHERQKVGLPVDIILFSQSEFERERKRVSIVSEALREGIVV